MNYRNSQYYPNNIYNPVRYNMNNRGPGGFLFPFALGFISSPLVYGATRPRPIPYYGPGYRPYPYYPYY